MSAYGPGPTAVRHLEAMLLGVRKQLTAADTLATTLASDEAARLDTPAPDGSSPAQEREELHRAGAAIAADVREALETCAEQLGGFPETADFEDIDTLPRAASHLARAGQVARTSWDEVRPLARSFAAHVDGWNSSVHGPAPAAYATLDLRLKSICDQLRTTVDTARGLGEAAASAPAGR